MLVELNLWCPTAFFFFFMSVGYLETSVWACEIDFWISDYCRALDGAAFPQIQAWLALTDVCSLCQQALYLYN